MISSTTFPLFLADENIKAKLVRYFFQKGCDICFAQKGVRNSSLLSLAKKGKRVLLTHDHDFLNEFLYPPEKYEGIVVLAVHPPSLSKQISLMEKLLAAVFKEEFSGKSFLLSEIGLEIRDKESSKTVSFNTRYG